MTIATFFHVGILVESLEEAIPRFERVLGINFLTPSPFQLQKLVDVAHFGDAEPHPWEGRAVFSRQGPPFYELLEAKGRGVYSLDERDEGLHHVGMMVEDARAQSLAMEEKDVRTSAFALGEGGVHTRFWFSNPASLHGVQLELIDNSSSVIQRMMEEAASYRR